MVDSIAETEMPKPDAPSSQGDKKPEPNLENIDKGLQAIQTMRSYVDAIPTPGRDAGDLTGDFSLFAITKDILGSALTLMEATRKPTRDEDIFQAVLDVGPGMASVATKAPAGAIGMFGSRPGVWASKEVHERYDGMLKRAEHMAETGDPEDKIWRETGMSKDHEGNWRYEISDYENTKIDWDEYDKMAEGWDVLNEGEGPATVELGLILDSPKVYEHWPELQNIPVTGYRGKPRNGEMGHYNVGTNSIHLNLDRLESPGVDPRATLRTLIHEAQHALQYAQNRPSGTNTEFAKSQMEFAIFATKKRAENARKQGNLTVEQEAALHKMTKIEKAWEQLKTVYKDMAAYYADPGEVEASLTELSLRRDQSMHHPRDRVGEGVVHPDYQFRPENLNFPARPVDMNDGTNRLGKTFGKRPSSQMAIPEKPDWALHWGGGELRKHGPNSFRLDLSDTTFGQVKKVGKQWEAELRDVASGDLIRSKGTWKSKADAEAELRSMNPIDYGGRPPSQMAQAPDEVFKVAPMGETESIGQVPIQRGTGKDLVNSRMTPSEFLGLAHHSTFQGQSSRETIEFLRGAIREQTQTIAPPWLRLQWMPDAQSWRVTGHEGRHRSVAAREELGEVGIPVQFMLRDENGARLREVTAEMRDALNRRQILPEK